jgi:hypothetical protein
VTTSQILLAGAVSLVFAALAVACAAAVRLLRGLARVWRWTAGTSLVLVVLMCWGATLAPRTIPDSGLACIEEPLFGMTPASNLATAECVAINRGFVAGSLGFAGVVTLGAVAWARIAARRRDPS